jgi:hypothetical protein
MGEAHMWFAISIFRRTSTAAAHTRGLAAEPVKGNSLRAAIVNVFYF